MNHRIDDKKQNCKPKSFPFKIIQRKHDKPILKPCLVYQAHCFEGNTRVAAYCQDFNAAVVCHLILRRIDFIRHAGIAVYPQFFIDGEWYCDLDLNYFLTHLPNIDTPLITRAILKLKRKKIINIITHTLKRPSGDVVLNMCNFNFDTVKKMMVGDE